MNNTTTGLTLYLDMDGVICNFQEKYDEIAPELPDKQRFAHAVLDQQIFLHLKPMSDAKKLVEHVATLKNITIEILTSVGTFDEERGLQAKLQKRAWLDKHNMFFTTNFVRCKAEKANYANKNTILIDDSIGCIDPFNQKGGWGILHTSADDTIKQLDEVFKKIREYRAYTT